MVLQARVRSVRDEQVTLGWPCIYASQASQESGSKRENNCGRMDPDGADFNGSDLYSRQILVNDDWLRLRRGYIPILESEHFLFLVKVQRQQPDHTSWRFLQNELRLAGWLAPTRGQITNLPHIGIDTLEPFAGTVGATRLENTTGRGENGAAVRAAGAE
jgi:hypothetical protein